MKNLILMLIVVITTSCSALNPNTFAPEISARICTAGGCGTAYNLTVGIKTVGITNAHVCQDTSDKKVYDKYGNFKETVKVIKILDYTDICIVERIAHLRNLPASDIKKPLKVGEYVYTQGFPYGRYTSSFGKVTDVLQNKTYKYHKFGPMTVLTNYANFGNSGSPALNMKGEVVGTIALKDYNNAGYYINLSNFIEEIKGL